MNKTSELKSIYINMFKKILYILAASIAVVSAGLIIVYPVWFFAVKYPSGYSVFIVITAILLILYTVSAKIRKKELSVRQLIYFITKIIYFIILVSGAGAAVVLFMNSLILQGSAVIVILFIASGAVVFLKKQYG